MGVLSSFNLLQLEWKRERFDIWETLGACNDHWQGIYGKEPEAGQNRPINLVVEYLARDV